MKVTKVICISEENNFNLRRENNVSKLIDDLLTSYYSKTKEKSLSELTLKRDEIRQNLKENRKNLREIEGFIRNLNEKNNKLKDLLKKFSKEDYQIIKNCTNELHLMPMMKGKPYKYADVKELWKTLRK